MAKRSGVSNDRDPLAGLTSLSRALTASRTRWYLFGAQAVVLYGIPRATADLDVTVEADPASFETLRSALAAEAIHPRVPYADELLARSRVLLLEHRPSGLPIDLVFAGPGLEVEFLNNARRVELADQRVVWVIAPTDLVVAKILAGRPKDLEDVRGIISTCGDDLDLDRARSFLQLLEQALDRSDLLRELERLVAEHAKQAD